MHQKTCNSVVIKRPLIRIIEAFKISNNMSPYKIFTEQSEQVICIKYAKLYRSSLYKYINGFYQPKSNVLI